MKQAAGHTGRIGGAMKVPFEVVTKSLSSSSEKLGKEHLTRSTTEVFFE
jgi:hypothetical protein